MNLEAEVAESRDRAIALQPDDRARLRLKKKKKKVVKMTIREMQKKKKVTLLNRLYHSTS